jgi:hypothetical protein
VTLTEEQIRRIKLEAEKFKEKTTELGNAAVGLWQARIDMAIASGLADNIDDVIRPPLRTVWGDDNCGCIQLPPTRELEIKTVQQKPGMPMTE